MHKKCRQCTLSRIIKRQVLTNSMVAILTFWSSTDSDHVRAVPVALLSITTNHSGARFWPQKEKTSASTFFSLSFVMIFFLRSVVSLKFPKSAKSHAKSRQSTFFRMKNSHFWASLAKTGSTKGQQSAAVHVIPGFFFEALFGH